MPIPGIFPYVEGMCMSAWLSARLSAVCVSTCPPGCLSGCLPLSGQSAQVQRQVRFEKISIQPGFEPVFCRAVAAIPLRSPCMHCRSRARRCRDRFVLRKSVFNLALSTASLSLVILTGFSWLVVSGCLAVCVSGCLPAWLSVCVCLYVWLSGLQTCLFSGHAAYGRASHGRAPHGRAPYARSSCEHAPHGRAPYELTACEPA